MSGYIGGDVLHGISNSGLASSIVALVRNSDKAAAIVQKYPLVKPLIGDLDSAALIQDAVSDADTVLRTYTCLYDKMVLTEDRYG